MSSIQRHNGLEEDERGSFVLHEEHVEVIRTHGREIERLKVALSKCVRLSAYHDVRPHERNTIDLGAVHVECTKAITSPPPSRGRGAEIMGAVHNAIRESETFESLLELYVDLLGGNRTRDRDIERKKDDLLVYGSHLGDCKSPPDCDCDCGFDSATKPSAWEHEEHASREWSAQTQEEP